MAQKDEKNCVLKPKCLKNVMHVYFFQGSGTEYR